MKQRRQFALGLCLLFVGFLFIAFGTPSRGQLMLMTGAGKAPGAASCSFPTLSSLIGNYRADTGVTLVGPNVTAVTNGISGGANPLVSSGTVPFNATSAYNSKPAFDFAVGNAAALSSALFPVGTGSKLSIFVVGRMNIATASFGGAVSYGVGLGNDFNGVGAGAFVVRDSNDPDGFTSVSQSWPQVQSSMAFATNHRFGVVYDGSGAGTVTQYIDGVQTAQDFGNSPWTDNGTIVIGNRYTSGAVGGGAWDGPILQVVVSNAAFTGTEISNLDTFLTCQYGP